MEKLERPKILPVQNTVVQPAVKPPAVQPANISQPAPQTPVPALQSPIQQLEPEAKTIPAVEAKEEKPLLPKSDAAAKLLKSAARDQKEMSMKKKGGGGGNIYFSAVSPLSVALSIRHLSLMLKSGLPIRDALQVLSIQSSDPRLKKAYGEIVENISNGQSLADSMRLHKKIFTGIVISIVDVGEQGGTLEKNLIFLADYLKKDYELKRKVKGALLYPTIVLALTIIEMIGVIFFILPKLQTLFASFPNIPSFTKSVLKFTEFVRGNYIYLAIGIFFIFILQFIFFKTKTGKNTKDILSLHLPVVKRLTQSNVLATFSRTLGILLESGIPISKALEISSTTIGNSVYRKVLQDIFNDLKNGENLADGLSKHSKYFPITFIKMIEIGEDTGTLEDNLIYLYDFHADEVQDISNNLTTLIEPVLMVFIGIMIGGLAFMIIGPIYQFTGSINS